MVLKLRLAVATILNSKHGQFTVLCAIVCSSWTTINMATSGRSCCTPLGREDRGYVQLANCMAARCFGEQISVFSFCLNICGISKKTSNCSKSFPPRSWTTLCPLRLPRLALLLYLIEAMSGCWMVEQPSLSLLRFHPRVMEAFSHFREPWCQFMICLLWVFSGKVMKGHLSRWFWLWL